MNTIKDQNGNYNPQLILPMLLRVGGNIQSEDMISGSTSIAIFLDASLLKIYKIIFI